MAGEVRISVRNLVEFILRSGDIDDRRQGSPENAMQEGSRIHRMIQRRMGAEYQAEVALKYTHPTENYVIIVEGRADGIIEQNGETTIDEIKGTYRDLAKLKAPLPLHIAQAKCYAYMYSLQRELPYIRVRLTYCNIETEDIRYFYEDYEFAKLEAWFQQLIGDYRNGRIIPGSGESLDSSPLPDCNSPLIIGTDKRNWSVMCTRPFIIRENCSWKRLPEWARPYPPYFLR